MASPENFRYLRFSDVPLEDTQRFDQALDSVGIRGIHFETGSFVLPSEGTEALLVDFNGEDVSVDARKLDQQNEGYRVVRVDYAAREVVVRDYSHGYIHIGFDGRALGVIPKEDAGVVFSPSRFTDNYDTRMFESIPEAIRSVLQQK
jgi:hypothetical protein